MGLWYPSDGESNWKGNLNMTWEQRARRDICGGFPKLELLEVPMVRTILFLGSILGSPYFGKLPYKDVRQFRVWGVSGFALTVRAQPHNVSCQASIFAFSELHTHSTTLAIIVAHPTLHGDKDNSLAAKPGLPLHLLNLKP